MISTKKCIGCHKIKPIEDFAKRESCDECRIKMHKNYVINKEKRRLPGKLVKTAAKKLARETVIKIKSESPCKDCGVGYPYYVMEFDHRPNTIKLGSINTLISNRATIQTILNEIEKCDLVCVICHRRRTHTRKPVKNIKWLDEIKNNPCMDCGGKFEHYAMDFDHISEKKTEVARIKYNKNKCLEEIKKCQLVCANCHRQRTYTRRHWQQPEVFPY